MQGKEHMYRSMVGNDTFVGVRARTRVCVYTNVRINLEGSKSFEIMFEARQTTTYSQFMA